MTPKSCLLCGFDGKLRVKKSGEQLLTEYYRYYGVHFSNEILSNLFHLDFYKYSCGHCDLHFFLPSLTGSSEYYGALASQLPWYYRACMWDKFAALKLLSDRNCHMITDYGCGDGEFLAMAQKVGVSGNGVDLSEKAIADAQLRGFQCYTPEGLPHQFQWAPTITIFQTLEHVSDPVQFCRDIVEKSACTRLIISVPTHNSLLGWLQDPLSWPPHHTTMWSENSLRQLAESISFDLVSVQFEPLDWAGFVDLWLREDSDRLDGIGFRLNRSPREARLRLVYAKYLLGRIFRRPWALRKHSVLALMERRDNENGNVNT